MNKKLLAVAIAGVLAAPLAQAQTANVTLYGRLNLNSQVIINMKNDATNPNPNVKQNIYQVNSNSSRLGVRGTESLGGGLNVIFQVEERFDASAAGAVTTGGDTYVGLQGAWGTAKIGYFLTPYDDVGSVFGSVPTLITGILGTQGLWSNSGFGDIASGAFDDRAANSLRYDSPVMAGFTVSGQVASRDTGGTDGGTLAQQRRHAYVLSVGSTYNNGPFGGAIAYEVHNATRDSTVAANPKLQDQALSLAASYKFGGWMFAAVGEWLKYDWDTGGEVKRNLWGISTTGNIGPGQLYAAYTKANNGSGSAKCTTVAGITSCPRILSVTLGPDSSAQTWEVSYTYPLSKRTLLYTGYVMVDNNSNANYTFGVGGAGFNFCSGNQRNAAGNNVGCGDAARPQGATAGIVHFF
jgi:predicted porin